MELVLGFFLGILASTIAWLITEYAASPSLAIVADDNHFIGQIPDPHEFYHVQVLNRPAHWPLPGRRPAWACTATLEVFRPDDSQATHGIVYARWTSQPEPLLPVVAQGQIGNVIDPARLMQARRMDVHGHHHELLSIAVKFEGEPDCYIFSNESYVHPKWQNPDWRLPPGRYRVRVTVLYDRGRAQRDFELRNDGPRRDDVSVVSY